jgi:hypothetical protein
MLHLVGNRSQKHRMQAMRRETRTSYPQHSKALGNWAKKTGKTMTKNTNGAQSRTGGRISNQCFAGNLAELLSFETQRIISALPNTLSMAVA